MTLASILTILSTLAAAPDLCGALHLDADGSPYVDALGQVFPRYCEPSGPDVPRLDEELCCEIDEAADAAVCDLPDLLGRCVTGERFYCEFGEVTEDGAGCYQPYVDACDLDLCLSYSGPPPENADAELLCCTTQGCEPLSADMAWVCADVGGYVALCLDGVTNEDGTVTCFH